MITSMINPMIRPMITNMINGDSLGTFRYFLDFDSTLETFGELAKAKTFAGDFDISAEISTTSSSSLQMIIASNSDTDNYIAITDLGKVRVKIDGVNTDSSDGAIPIDGKLHKLRITRTGTTLKKIVDEVAVDTDTLGSVLDFLVDATGSNSSGFFFQGVIANVDFGDGEIYPINQANPTKDFELPLNNVFGSEEVVNGDFATDLTGWTTVLGANTFDAGNAKVARSSGNVGRLSSTAITTIIGDVYQITFTVPSFTAGSRTVRVAISATSGVGAIFDDQGTETGTKTGVFTATQTTHWVQLECGSGSDGDFALFDNISVKSVTNALILNNAPEANRNQFQLVGDDWIGVTQEVINGSFATDSDWTLTGSTISGGTLNNTVTTGIFASQAQEVGTFTYTTTYDVPIATSGTVSFSLGNVNSATQNSTGTYNEIITGNGTNNINITSRFGPAFVGSIDNMSVKRILLAP